MILRRRIKKDVGGFLIHSIFIVVGCWNGGLSWNNVWCNTREERKVRK
jgi:hypothetical protein